MPAPGSHDLADRASIFIFLYYGSIANCGQEKPRYKVTNLLRLPRRVARDTELNSGSSLIGIRWEEPAIGKSGVGPMTSY